MSRASVSGQGGQNAPQLARSSGSYAFLNHSPTTLPNNLPPSVDDKPLARQRRRRTSPEDQAILEAAYLHDPKPDKVARSELVSQVALNEKEVQIWFQNRRQTSRRKSRPLLPHEVAQYQLARANAAPTLGSDVSDDSIASGADDVISSARHEEGDDTSSHPIVAGSTPTEPAKADPTPAFNAMDYLANRRSGAPSLRLDESIAASSTERRVTKTAGDLRRSSSFIRLSMTADGKAQVVTDSAFSPSPPRPTPVIQPSDPIAMRSLTGDGRPYSATALHRSSSGRSRDSRAWEFWCDKDARLDLQDKAQKDASGSAADAIGLLRSASGRRVLGPMPSRRNFGVAKTAQSPKRSKSFLAARQFHRSTTSSGRLQDNRPADPKHDKISLSICLPGNESDKENWTPSESALSTPSESGEQIGQQWLERSQSSYDCKPAPRMGAEVHAMRATGKSMTDADGNDPEGDREIAAFMRGGRRSNSTPEEEEMDCVQGLLSLSQGNWR